MTDNDSFVGCPKTQRVHSASHGPAYPLGHEQEATPPLDLNHTPETPNPYLGGPLPQLTNVFSDLCVSFSDGSIFEASTKGNLEWSQPSASG